MTIQQSLNKATNDLKKANIISSQLDATILLSFVLNKSKEFLIANPSKKLTIVQQKKFIEIIKKRSNHEPVSYITNSIEFYGINFYVDKRVLSPRVETESIVEQAIKLVKPDSSLIDIGTGSGAIAISIAKHRPDIDIVATDISANALEVAKLNAKHILGSNYQIKFIKSDIFENISGVFDCIVTNLPYVSLDYKPRMKAEVSKEPSVALFGGKGDGLSLYKKFYNQVLAHTANQCLILHESDPWQHPNLTKLAQNIGFRKIYEDYLVLGFEKK